MPEEPTSPDLVDLTRRTLEVANRRDFDATMSFYSLDAVWDMSPMGLGRYEGAAAVRGFVWANYFDALEEIDIKPESYLDAGDSVVTPNTSRLRGRDGIEVFARSTFVFTFASGELTRICLYQEKKQALKAVGVTE
jgi:ketosteroid isomerase-like protein